MHASKFFIAVFLLALPFVLKAQNLALHKKYNSSVSPNYSRESISYTSESALTDGVYTKGHFWSQTSTVGWQGGMEVTITIDLGKTEPIAEVDFNTARNQKSGVSFPQNIYLFLSNDNQNFLYIGDIANTPDNRPGDYLVKKFSLKQIKCSGRYVYLRIIPKSKVIFCDEIEVLKGEYDIAQQKSLLSTRSIDSAIHAIKSFEFKKNNLSKAYTALQQNFKYKSNLDRKQFGEIAEDLSNQDITKNRLPEIENTLQKARASALKTYYKTAFVVEKCDPWDTLNSIFEPTQTKAEGKLNYNFSIPSSYVQYGAFAITNTNTSPQQFYVTTSKSNMGGSAIALFTVVNVPSADFKMIPDALVPLNSSLTLQPGGSAYIIFKITAIKKGIINPTIYVRGKNKTIPLNLSVIVYEAAPVNPGILNTINWAYLDRPVLADRKNEVVKDLQQHHINTISVPPPYVPLPGNLNFDKLLSYLSFFKYAKNILLIANFSSPSARNTNQNLPYLSAEWKKEFADWYPQMLRAIKNSGITADIYLYPYDEVHGKDIQDFRSFATWAKASISELKIYATLSVKAAVDTILPLVDVAQVLDNPELYEHLNMQNPGIWLYDVAKSPARSLSPYTFYRLMAWKAFVNGFKGIGFWAYADEGIYKQQYLIDAPLINPNASYSVVYGGSKNKIFSSRRWEAFQLGIEDYNLLNLYAVKFGITEAVNFAKQVVSSPNDTKLADLVREKIIKAL